ncbi:MAG: YdcF family protein [Planctomycetota bacterium]
MLRRLLELLVLPPTSALVLILAGTALRRRRPKAGRTLQIAGIAWIWLASTPCVGGMLLHSLQGYPALAPNATLQADAIVVLSAGSDHRGAEYGGAVAGPITMQRLRYGAALQRRTGLPLLVSGGRPGTDLPSLGEMMRRAADQEFGLAGTIVEGRSADTRGNARESATILRERGWQRILLVTSAWHMPRSVDCFAREGVQVVAAPTAFRGEVFASWTSFVPHWTGLRDTCMAMHEWAGRLVYAVRD